MKVFIVYDGRARYDVSEASMIECMSDISKKQAIKSFKSDYENTDYVLFEYDEDGGELINGCMVEC
jgi:hypothetical protein